MLWIEYNGNETIISAWTWWNGKKTSCVMSSLDSCWLEWLTWNEVKADGTQAKEIKSRIVVLQHPESLNYGFLHPKRKGRWGIVVLIMIRSTRGTCFTDGRSSTRRCQWSLYVCVSLSADSPSPDERQETWAQHRRPGWSSHARMLALWRHLPWTFYEYWYRYTMLLFENYETFRSPCYSYSEYELWVKGPWFAIFNFLIFF